MLNTLTGFQISGKLLYFSNFGYFFHRFSCSFLQSSWWVVLVFFQLNCKYLFSEVVWPFLYIFHLESFITDISCFSLNYIFLPLFWHNLLVLTIFWPLCNIKKEIKLVWVCIHLLNFTKYLMNSNGGLIILITKVNLK